MHEFNKYISEGQAKRLAAKVEKTLAKPKKRKQVQESEPTLDKKLKVCRRPAMNR